MTHFTEKMKKIGAIAAILGVFLTQSAVSDSGEGAYYRSISDRNQAFSNYYRALRSLPAKATRQDQIRLSDQYIVPAESQVSKNLHGFIKNKMAENNIVERGSKQAAGRSKSDLSYKPISSGDRKPAGSSEPGATPEGDANGVHRVRQKGVGSSVEGSHIPRKQEY